MPDPVAAADLKALGLESGLDAVGVAAAETFTSTRRDLDERKAAGLSADMAFTYRNPARSTEPQRILDGARSIVVGAKSYRLADHDADDTTPHGRVARYAWVDHYELLRSALTPIAESLQADGWQASIVIDSNALVDREAAYRAGIGWYGKNANILVPAVGSWFVLGNVVTDAPLDVDAPVPDGCGTCRRCIDLCPTAAIVEPGVIDARRCLAWLVQARGVFPLEFREALGDRIYGCDDCQEVCPPNRATDRRTGLSVPVALVDRPSSAAQVDQRQDWVPLVDLIEATDDEIFESVGRWYIPDRDADAVRRNALVALGNVADPEDVDVRRVVDACLSSEAPMVRAHAVWAARRLGLEQLVQRLIDDPDPWVRAELDADVDIRCGTA